MADREQVLCVHPYRDSDETKISMSTKDVTIVGYGVPSIQQRQLKDAVATALSLIRQSSGGEIESIEVFQNGSL